MDAMSATAGAQAVASTPPPQPPSPVEAVKAPEAVEGKGKGQPFNHALFQGQGGKNGILKRMETEDIATVQSELGLKAAGVAERIVAERATPEAAIQEAQAAEKQVTPLVEFATPQPIKIPLTEPVQAVPVDAARLGGDPIEAIQVDVPDSLAANEMTQFVQAAGIAAEDE